MQGMTQMEQLIRKGKKQGAGHWIFGAFLLMINTMLYAAGPLWTFSAPNPAQLTVTSTGTGTVHYTVTSQTKRTKTLLLKTTPGLSATLCHLAGKGSICSLTLTVSGSQIPQQGVQTGPVLCEKGNPNQCYQPSETHQLKINRTSITSGHLLLRENGMPISALTLSPNDNGTLVLTNAGQGSLSSLNIQFPFGWGAYFINNCPAVLASQQSCTIDYTIPAPAANGILNPLTIAAADVDNSINLPVTIQTIGAAKCWGLNVYGQLGSIINSGNFNANDSPLDVQSLSSGVVAITGGNSHTCALLNSGGVQCWGRNNYGELGSNANIGTNNSNDHPLDVQTLSSGVLMITAGEFHTCALLNNGTVQCWGRNNYGQLGSSTHSGTNTPNSSPLAVQGLSSGVIAITAGVNHTCALLNSGAIQCWGLNQNGQLGSITNSGFPNPNHNPMAVQTLNSGVVAITGGNNHTCALLNSGAVQCWGDNAYGQLGALVNIGTNNANDSPLSVQTLNSGVIAITGGAFHSCALLDSGAVQCWGLNYFGQLGSTDNNLNSNPNSVPLAVQTLSSGVIAIVGGASQTCALLNSGAVKCWGRNNYGQLGSTLNSGNDTPNNSPLDVQTLTLGGAGALLNHNLGFSNCAITV